MLDHQQREKIYVEMCLKWPSKFTDQDLNHWCDQLGNFGVDEILSALTQWKSEQKFVPKLPEIRARLAKLPEVQRRTAAPSKFYTAIAASVAAANPAYADKPEAELILRYHRHQLFSYRKRMLSDHTGRMREPTEADLARITERRGSIYGQCVRDLWCVENAGATLDQAGAENLAKWFDASRSDFDLVLAELGGAVFA